MPYCVNCGVELEKSQAACPLCGVKAYHPHENYDPALPKPYSTHIVRVQRSAQRRVAVWIVTVVMILVAAICVMANLVYDDMLTWSVYVVSSLMLLWMIVMLPLHYPKINPAAAVLLDVCALLLFLYLLNRQDTRADWYMRLAVPQVLLFGVLGLLDVAVFKSKRFFGWQRYGLVVMSIGMAMMGLEVILDLYNEMQVRLTWSWFVILPAFGLGLVFFLLERRREVKEAIYKRLRL